MSPVLRPFCQNVGAAMADDDAAEAGDKTTTVPARSAEDTPTLLRAPHGPRDDAMLAPGATVAGRYRIVALVGRGGMGSVYRADDLVLGQAVALKFISTRASPGAIELLTDEVRIGRRITHPNVCRLHDIVENQGQRFLVMEFVDGEDLSSLLRRLGSLPHETALAIARDVAAGLAAAHAEGVVHRDLKPGNVMIDGRGRARITDFGLAIAAADADARREVAGTPAYMAPEQLRGDAVDARADLYALGLILCELLTGRRLNQGRSLTEIAASPASVPASLAAWVPQIDPALERFVLRALDPDPARRPASARELLALLPVPDPLTSAVAAGETPTPEMVAAAATRGTLTRAVGLAMVVAIVAGLLVVAAIAQRSRLQALARVPPDTLQARARAVVERLAPGLVAARTAWWFEPDRELLRSPEFRAARTWQEVAALDPGLVRFVYRQGEDSLVARNAADTISSLYILQGGRVTFDDPPLAAGMATVVLDRTGGLLRADAITAEGEPRADTPGPRPIPRRRPATGLARLSAGLQVSLMLLSFGVAIVFALRNRRSGRADERGATRISVYACLSLLASWVLACDHASDPAAELRLFSIGFGSAVTAAVILWFFYLALEPFVRRRFPLALVSWSRLLNGRLRDSLVARDLVVGIAGGVAARLLLDALAAAPPLWGGQAGVVATLQAIGPFRRTLGNFLLLQVDSLEFGIGAIFLLVFLQRAVRKTWAAIALWMAIFLGTSLAYPGAAPYLALLLALLLRFGLLAAVAANLVAGVLLYASLTLDPTAWFFGRSVAVLATLASVACALALVATRPAPAATTASLTKRA
jgi:serine/threonine-protein kinase